MKLLKMKPMNLKLPYFEEVIVNVSEGILFSERKVKINFTSKEQDVISLLGPPNQIFYKQED